MRRIIHAVALSAVWPCVASANPVAMHMVVVQQVPATTHVQITSAYDLMDPSEDAQSAERDGDSLDGVWTGYSGFLTNMGSGVTSVYANQYCDCNVPFGTHTYRVWYDDWDYVSEFLQTIEVLADYTQPEPPANEGGACGVYPWDEPSGTGGTEEPTGTPASVGPGGSGGGQGVRSEVSSTGSGDDSGCAVGMGAPRRGWLTLALLGSVLLLRGRRRRIESDA